MASHEILDIFNPDQTWIGTASRAEAHAKGLWHQTFHCWVIEPQTKHVLLQLRHRDKDTFPGKLDVSSAGHLLAGESVRDGVRELEEELGLAVRFEELRYCGVVPQQSIIAADLIDREFNHVFLYASTQPLAAYRFQEEEISGLYYIGLDDFRQLTASEIKEAWIEGIRIDETTGVRSEDRRSIGLQDLTPNTEAYYELLFEQALAADAEG
ncbi:hypothetical protein PA598K_00118 [Paenibacillus sp. 598K]|uniref:NUDIX hydrolase n=1 Tax=Paenibacillus sp. 598K TaxID=1117987 RepID=UPI000FFA1484|nr:NUDIX domain-containing protein [Paenibacillus sp. 598K]GBF71905.1 hypothetical protein PA598K_00118 [Paenibacillus sp. 598K]